MAKEYVCIVCPSSCRLTVEEVNEEVVVTGHECKRGIAHGVSEHCNPLRMITTTVAISGGTLPRLPIISTAEIPKSKVDDCLKHLYSIVVTAPIKCGDILCKDICSTGVDIIASRSMDKKKIV